MYGEIMILALVIIVYCVIGIGVAKVLDHLNKNDSGWDGGVVFGSFFLWPLCLIVCAFWNFK